MKTVTSLLEKIFKFFSSLQLAVIVLSGLAIVSAYGTIVEAQYDASYAQKTVYHSPIMYLLQALLVVNLFNVMIDRLPWKRHHLGFILAHIGIISVVFGSVITRYWGVDGNMTFEIGQANRYAMIPAETEFAIYSTFGNGNYQLMHQTRDDFFQKNPEKNDFTFNLGNKALKVTKYYPFAQRQESIVEGDGVNDGPGVRFQIQNDKVNMSQWILRDRKQIEDVVELGPARVILAEVISPYRNQNEVVLAPNSKVKDKLDYVVYTVSKKGLTKKGQIGAGDVVELGWMGLELRVLKYLPSAKQEIKYIEKTKPTELTVPAVTIQYDGAEQWLGLNSSLRLFGSESMYLVVYANKRIDVGFDIQLDEFVVGRYQGTMRAASYASDVTLEDGRQFNISMNNPLKHNGFTFYQASFQENDAGEPIASILSVNKDPGRWVKYLGSLLVVLGSIVMFYMKRMAAKKANKPTSQLQEA